MSRLWRLFHPELARAPRRRFDLGDEEAHHVRRVLRLKAGERVAVFDGAGGEWGATLSAVDKRRVSVELGEPLAGGVEAPVEVELFQALGKPEGIGLVIQKATEIGLTAIRVFPARRSGPFRISEARLVRWRRIAVEACKQCGRRRLPRLEIDSGLPAPPPEVLGLLLDTRPGAPPLARAAGDRETDRIWVAVGPESGLEDDEAGDACRAGWHAASLGPRTLRTETAGLVATSILLHLRGDLGAAEPTGPFVDSPGDGP